MILTYKIEDNIDFYKEINDLESDNDTILNDEEICLLSNDKLQRNYIELNCGHKFNYTSLINEVCSYKFNYNVYNKNVKLYNTMCPYCRKYTKGLIPYIPTEYSVKIKYVNTPIKFCFKNKICTYNNYYNNSCNENAFDSNYGTYCNKHYNIIDKYKNFINDYNWNNEMIFFYKKNKINDIKILLKNRNLKVSGNKIKLMERYFNL